MPPSYYDPPSPPLDGADGTLIFVLLFAAFIAALVWLINWAPDKENKKKEKSLEQKVEDVFADLEKNADTFARKEFIPALQEARKKVVTAIREN